MPPSSRAGRSSQPSSGPSGLGGERTEEASRSSASTARRSGRSNDVEARSRNTNGRTTSGREGNNGGSLHGPRVSETSQSHRYAPTGNAKEKRELRQEYRSLIGLTQEARSNLADTRPADVTQILKRSHELFERVEAPSESVLDSRFLLNAAEMAAQMAKSMKVGSDFEVDEYLARCARLIGGRLRGGPDGEEEDEDMDVPDADYWHWDKLGRKAVKRSRRAVTMDHLLGPLEVTHNKRNFKKRTGVDKSAPVVNPQQLQAEDLVNSSNETSALVRQISARLQQVGGSKGVNLFKFVIDPSSFSNTVENLFYVSFLIREGTASLDTENDDGEPILMSCEMPSAEDYEQGVRRRQIVLELDMYVWRELIKMYDIRAPLIESRATEQHAQSDTWTRQSSSSQKGKAA